MSSGGAAAAGLAQLLGYDPALVVPLSAEHARDLAAIASAWCWSAAVLAIPFAHAVWLLEHSAPMTLAAAAGVFALIIQLLRLAIAGGGVPPSRDDEGARSHRAALTPVLFLALLGLMFAQLAQLPVRRNELDAAVTRERTRLMQAHDSALAQLAMPPEQVAAASSDTYEAELARCEFVVLRLRTLWRDPWQAGRLTLLYLVALLGPALVARLSGRRGSLAYELARRRLARRLIRADVHRQHAALMTALARYPSYTRREPSDPFADERLMAPLAMRWPIHPVTAAPLGLLQRLRARLRS